MCAGQCVPACATGLVRTTSCNCGCTAEAVLFWQLRYLTVASATLSNAPANGFAGNGGYATS